MSIHVFPILNPPSHLPPHPIPQGRPSAQALGVLSHAIHFFIQYILIVTELLLCTRDSWRQWGYRSEQWYPRLSTQAGDDAGSGQNKAVEQAGSG